MPATSGSSRSSVATSSGRSSTSGSSCLGRDGVLSGQKREPTPPASTTAHRLTRSPRLSSWVSPASSAVRAYSFFGTERLREKLGRAELHRLLMLRFLAGCGEDDARQVLQPFVRPNAREHIEPAEVRHHEVEQHEVDVRLALQQVDRFLTVVRERDAKRPLLELHLDDAADVRLIIGDQHVALLHTRRGPLDQGRHVLAIPAKLEQQLADVRLRLHEHEKHRLGREHRHDHEARRVFEDAGDELTALARGTKLVGRGNDGGDVRRESFRIEIRDGLTVDEEPVTAEDDRCFDAIALPDGGDEFADRRHARSP